MKFNFNKILLLCSLLLPSILFAQEQSLTVTVKDHEQSLLAGATVQLTRVQDSVSYNAITSPDGSVRFTNVQNTLHTVIIRFLGYEPFEKSFVVRPNERSFIFYLKEDIVTLGEVAIVAKRPIIRQEDDKMIIDPEPLVNVSTNTLEVLEKTPGLFVDQDGGIYLSSATPASVYINGREQRMSSQDIATILRSLPPGSVQRIEVLRTPSTKYDAASSGGIVNIVLKKGMRIGRFGSVNAGMNQGVLGNRFVGVSFNNSGDNTTRYLNVNLSSNNYLEELSSVRVLGQESQLDQQAETNFYNNQGYIGYGISYDAGAKLNLSYDGRINGNRRRSDAFNKNLIENTLGEIFSENLNITENNSLFLSFQQDLGINLKLDTLGSEWENKISYAYNDNHADQFYTTEYIFPLTGLLNGEGNNYQGRHFFLVQSDLTYQLRHRIKLETGLKATFQNYDSRSDYYFRSNGSLVENLLRTNAFSYQERISAAYAQASVPLPGELLLKTGVRMENTNMQGRQRVPADTSFVVNRTDFFPYIFLSRALFNAAGFEMRGYLIYRRTIGRPDYQNLNPDIRFVDQYLYESGNPALKPQFTDNIEANISFDEIPIFAIGRNRTRDIFSQVVYRDNTDESVAVRTYDNVGKSDETYFRITGAIPPGGKYFFVAGTQYNLNEYSGLYESQPFTFRRGSWRFFTFHSLNLTKNTRLTMMGFMMSRGQMNFYELNTFGQLNFSLNQTFMNKKLNVSVFARDVLKTMPNRFTLNQGSMLVTGERYTDNRRIGVNLRYSFGIRKKEERRNMMQFEMEE